MVEDIKPIYKEYKNYSELVEEGYVEAQMKQVPNYREIDTKRFLDQVSKVKDDLQKNLLTKETIISKSIARSKSGIYFLIKNDEIVYVGQSKSLDARIGNHSRGRKEDFFDRVAKIECEQKYLDQVETAYILLFRPKNNCDTYGRPRIPCKLTAMHILRGDNWFGDAYITKGPNYDAYQAGTYRGRDGLLARVVFPPGEGP